LDLQFISSGVAARSLQDALIWLSGLTPKKTAWWGWEMRPVRLRLCPPPRSPAQTEISRFSANSIVAKAETSRSVIGIVDGLSSRAIESEDDKQNRSKLLRDLGYKK
jgi:hypothetical protein